MNISVYGPLIGSTYIELPSRLKHSKKGLINIKKNDNKCFLWCHIRHLNPLDKSPQRITKEDKRMINDLDYEEIKFPVSKTDYCKIERQNNICITVFCYENGLSYPVYVSNQKFRDCMALLLVSDENKSHYVHIIILGLSKLLVYEFHYKYIKNKFDTKLLFTDTDSLVYEIKIEGVYEDFYPEVRLDSNFFDPVNKNVIGQMKYEFKGKKLMSLLD